MVRRAHPTIPLTDQIEFADDTAGEAAPRRKARDEEMKLHAPGDQVIWRSRPLGQIGYVIPFVVAEETPEAIVLFQQAGSVCKKRSGPRGGPRGRMLLVDQWDGTHVDVEWNLPGVGRLHLPNSMISVMRQWDPDLGEYHGWYVNLEKPWRRTKLGFDSEDLVLDVVVSDDLSLWNWKDEDEFDYAIASGRIAPEDAQEIRAEGERAAHLAERKEFPFVDHMWKRWRPDPAWEVARIPDGWDRD